MPLVRRPLPIHFPLPQVDELGKLVPARLPQDIPQGVIHRTRVIFYTAFPLFPPSAGEVPFPWELNFVRYYLWDESSLLTFREWNFRRVKVVPTTPAGPVSRAPAPWRWA